MKKNSLLLCIIIISLISLFSNCEKDKTQAPPAISLTNLSAKDSVYFGESCTVTGVASTSGKLSEIRFFRSFPYNGGESEVEMAGTKLSSFANESTADFSVVVPNIKDATKISVRVADQDGQETSTVVAITIRKSNILSYRNLQLGGWDSNYGSCLDVDSGTPMSGSAVSDPILAPKVDVFFDDSKLGNVDLDSIYYDNVSRLKDTGIRYATTKFTSADFDAMKGDDLFKDMMATLPIIPIEVNSVVFFKAKSGKKGLLRVSELTSPTGDLLLDEKIQK